MAKSLSYQEAVAKGLVYPGAEQEALKITGGGKGFADTESYKKAFETSYQAKKSEISNYQTQIDQAQRDRDIAQQARRTYQDLSFRIPFRAQAGKKVGGMIASRNAAAKQYSDIVNKYGISAKIISYDDNRFASAFNDQVNRILEQRKSASQTMEQAMAKYQAATKEAVTVEKRETGAAAAARKRLTRGTAGLLAKAGGAGGMVGTGLPELGTGVSGGLGLEGQLGRKMTL